MDNYIQKSLRSRQLVHVSLSRKKKKAAAALQAYRNDRAWMHSLPMRGQWTQLKWSSECIENNNGNGYWVRMFENISASFRLFGCYDEMNISRYINAFSYLAVLFLANWHGLWEWHIELILDRNVVWIMRNTFLYIERKRRREKGNADTFFFCMISVDGSDGEHQWNRYPCLVLCRPCRFSISLIECWSLM